MRITTETLEKWRNFQKIRDERGLDTLFSVFSRIPGTDEWEAQASPLILKMLAQLQQPNDPIPLESQIPTPLFRKTRRKKISRRVRRAKASTAQKQRNANHCGKKSNYDNNNNETGRS